jgi:adenylate kinase family enzyme
MTVPVPDKIHVFGASGSGTTTLAAAIAARFGHRHLDVDDFFWEPTDPPFQNIREVTARQRMLTSALDACPRWVLSGSLCGWGDIFIPRFELVVFLHIPHELRMSRILVRDRERYGDAIHEGGAMRAHHLEFIEWAAQYDTADEHMRSLRLHQNWMATLPCRCIRLEGDLTTAERIARIEAGE